MRNVLRADRSLGEAARERVSQRRVAMRLQKGVLPLDLGNPRARPPMRQLGEIRG
jgi:hypothetical protein